MAKHSETLGDRNTIAVPAQLHPFNAADYADIPYQTCNQYALENPHLITEIAANMMQARLAGGKLPVFELSQERPLGARLYNALGERFMDVCNPQHFDPVLAGSVCKKRAQEIWDALQAKVNELYPESVCKKSEASAPHR